MVDRLKRFLLDKRKFCLVVPISTLLAVMVGSGVSVYAQDQDYPPEQEQAQDQDSPTFITVGLGWYDHFLVPSTTTDTFQPDKDSLDLPARYAAWQEILVL